MPSSRETFTENTQKNSTRLLLENQKNIEVLPEFSASESEIPDFQAASVPQKSFEVENPIFQEATKVLPKNSFKGNQQTSLESDKIPNYDQGSQKQSRIKRDPIFNDSLKIGLVFLLIAAGLAFLPALLQLAVLFALVAMIFVFIGLKKLFNRRAKEKKKRQRRENMQMKKDKIKDILN